MTDWIKEVQNDLDRVDDFIREYDKHYLEAKQDIQVEGNLITLAKKMPSIIEIRYSQFEDINTIMAILEHILARRRSKHFVNYTENYQRSLSSRDIQQYIDGEDDVFEVAEKLAKVTRLRNKFAGVSKALEAKQFQISNIVKLKVAGLDDVDVGL